MQQTPKTAVRILLLAIGLLLFAVVGFKSAQTVSSANPIRGKQRLFMLSRLARQSPLASPPAAQGTGTYRLAETPPATVPNTAIAPVPVASPPAAPEDTGPVSARPVPATRAQASVPAATNPQPVGDVNRPGQASAAESPATLRPLSRLLF